MVSFKETAAYDRRGFTLMELLIANVILILAMLATMTFFAGKTERQRSLDLLVHHIVKNLAISAQYSRADFIAGGSSHYSFEYDSGSFAATDQEKIDFAELAPGLSSWPGSGQIQFEIFYSGVYNLCSISAFAGTNDAPFLSVTNLIY